MSEIKPGENWHKHIFKEVENFIKSQISNLETAIRSIESMASTISAVITTIMTSIEWEDK